MERENRKSGYDGSLETLRKEKGKKRERDKGKKQREKRRWERQTSPTQSISHGRSQNTLFIHCCREMTVCTCLEHSHS